MLQSCSLKEEGTSSHELAGETIGNSVPIISIFLAGSTFFSHSPFSVLEYQHSALHLFQSLGHRHLSNSCILFLYTGGIAALCL